MTYSVIKDLSPVKFLRIMKNLSSNSICTAVKHQLFVLAKSEKCNKEKIKFRVFKYIHHEAVDKKVTRRENINKLQSFNGCKCKLAFRINLNQRGPYAGLYKIKPIVIDHNHYLTQKPEIAESEEAKLQSVIDKQTKIDGKNHIHYILNEEGDDFYGLF